jgi:hypothetical protein
MGKISLNVNFFSFIYLFYISFAFIMFPEIPARDSYLVGGSGISLTSLNNFAAVPFLLGRDYIGFCGL